MPSVVINHAWATVTTKVISEAILFAKYQQITHYTQHNIQKWVY